MALAHAVEVNAVTVDRPKGPELSVTWTWAPALLEEASVKELAEGWFAELPRWLGAQAHREREG